MRLSIVIPCFNSAQTLGEQLDALAGQTILPWEVILADNGSRDEARTIAAHYQTRLPNLRIIDASDRPGAAHARNAGARAATGEAIAFCDADDVVALDWVAAMTRALSQHDFVASRFESHKLNCPEIFRTRGYCQDKGLQQFNPPFLPYAAGCGLGIRRSIHLAVGGLDETLSAHEDTDYCLRIQLAGTPLHFASDAGIHIRYRTDLKTMYRQAFTWAKAKVLIHKKYMPYGLQRPPLGKSVRELLVFCIWLVVKLVRMAPASTWVWAVGSRLGRIAGAIRYRVLMF